MLHYNHLVLVCSILAAVSYFLGCTWLTHLLMEESWLLPTPLWEQCFNVSLHENFSGEQLLCWRTSGTFNFTKYCNFALQSGRDSLYQRHMAWESSFPHVHWHGCCMSSKSISVGTSLVAQWLRICLPMQGTWVQALVQEDPTCRGATKPVCHNYWAHTPLLLKPAHLEPMLHNKRSHRNEKPAYHNEEWPPPTTTRESPHAAMKTQHSQKKKKKGIKFW